MAQVKLKSLPADATLEDVKRAFNEQTEALQFILNNLDSRNIKSLDASKIKNG